VKTRSFTRVTRFEAALPDLTGRAAVITGANSGIGWHTAKAMALQGCRVVLACRDVDRGKYAAERIRAARRDVEVDVAHLDLASMTSVREFAESRFEPFDFLINNAGVMYPPKRTLTADGFELQFGTNHLGHFVLTGLLLPLLLQTDQPRVVTVSSIAHKSGGADVVDANAMGQYNQARAYANSKLANLLFAQELQRRADAKGSPLVSTAAHPGFAATGLVGDSAGLGNSRVLRLLGPIAFRMVAQSAAAGAQATLYAATTAGPGSYSGPQRFAETRGPVGPAKISDLAADARLAGKLWGVSEDLTGFRYAWPLRPS
jgi:NAD(P)-dependent dehydrogenase (short-subunit alcohol dehydrogenase family)